MTRTYELTQTEKTVVFRMNEQLKQATELIPKLQQQIIALTGGREGACSVIAMQQGATQGAAVNCDFDNGILSWEEPDAPAAAALIPEAMPYQDYGAVLDANERP